MSSARLIDTAYVNTNVRLLLYACMRVIEEVI
jgi:hypothetical protein